jgi:hypothetical protein
MPRNDQRSPERPGDIGRRASPAPGFAQLIYHVLAHVQLTAALAASAYDRRYVSYVERRLGPASERPLGEDLAVLGRIAPSHEALARLQLLAWLVRDIETAAGLGDRALSELAPGDVDDPELLAELDPSAELLWCAALLELEAFRALPPVELESSALGARFERALMVAPALGECRIEIVRALCRRGRIRRRVIWVGLPEPELGVSHGHVLWQACHEATVHELATLARTLPAAARPSERELEHAAVVRLAERAASAGEGDEHRAWLAHFGANAPPTARACLPERALRLLLD